MKKSHFQNTVWRKPKKHIKSKEFDAVFSDYIRIAFEIRNDCDYEDFFIISAEEVENRLHRWLTPYGYAIIKTRKGKFLNTIFCSTDSSRGLNMRKTINDIRIEVLALSASERASLAHDLILSLDNPDDLELEPEQETEIKRRVQIVQEGKASGRSLESVVSDIQAEYNK